MKVYGVYKFDYEGNWLVERRVFMRLSEAINFAKLFVDVENQSVREMIDFCKSEGEPEEEILYKEFKFVGEWEWVGYNDNSIYIDTLDLIK